MFLASSNRDKLDAMRCTDEVLGKGSTTALVSRGRLRVKTTYEEGVCNCEKVEEYDVRTDELLLRKWRQNKGLGGMSKFVIELGEEAGASAVNKVSVTDGDKDLLFRPSNNRNPVFMPQDSKMAWRWRIRNLPYPKDVYKITIDNDAQQIILRTTNKKYFKKFDIPALKRAGMPLDRSDLSFSHEGTTLIILYAKPRAVLYQEEQARQARKRAPKNDGAIDPSSCKQQ